MDISEEKAIEILQCCQSVNAIPRIPFVAPGFAFATKARIKEVTALSVSFWCHDKRVLGRELFASILRLTMLPTRSLEAP